MNKSSIFTIAAAGAIAAGCASMPSSQELDSQAQAIITASFRDQGIATVDRLNQDLGQRACSSDKPPSEALAKEI
jgi:sulfur-oxidizing protein SoxX